jgi:hypothetical protein
MPDIKLPGIKEATNDKQMIQNLYDAVYRLKKELEFLLNNLDDDNIRAITTDKIIAGEAKISSALIDDLVVGDNVIMGPNARISWGKVDDIPEDIVFSEDIANFITTGAVSNKLMNLLDNSNLETILGEDYIITGKLSANQIATGQLSANIIGAKTITADKINATDLAAERLMQSTLTPNNYGEIGGTYGDLALFYDDLEYFRIYNDLPYGIQLQYKPIGAENEHSFLTITRDNEVPDIITARPKNVWVFEDSPPYYPAYKDADGQIIEENRFVTKGEVISTDKLVINVSGGLIFEREDSTLYVRRPGQGRTELCYLA